MDNKNLSYLRSAKRICAAGMFVLWFLAGLSCMIHGNPPTRPLKPTTLKATKNLYTYRIRVTGYFVKEATQYKIYRSTSKNRIGTLVKKTVAYGWNDCIVEVGKTYYYRVKACNSSGCSDYSNRASGSTKWMRPGRIKSLRASDGWYPDKVLLKYVYDPKCYTVRPGTRFEIYRSKTRSSPGILIANTTNQFTWVDTSVIPGVDYFYRIKMCNQKGCGDLGSPEKGYALASKPETPKNIEASNGIFSNRVRVSKYTVPLATTYKIYRSTDKNKTGQLVRTTTDSKWDDFTVTPGVTYFYRVMACNRRGYSDHSKHDSGFVFLYQPAKPTTIHASDGTYTDKIRVSSYHVAGATSYKIYRSTVPDSHGSVVKTTSATVWDDRNVTTGKKYYYRIQACNNAGCSPFSTKDSGYAKSKLRLRRTKK